MVAVWVLSEDGLHRVSSWVSLEYESEESRRTSQILGCASGKVHLLAEMGNTGRSISGGSLQAFVLREVGAEVSVRQVTHPNIFKALRAAEVTESDGYRRETNRTEPWTPQC